MEKVLRGLCLAVAVSGMTAVPAFAQEAQVPATKGYVSLFGGTVWAGDSTGSVILEGGARVAPHVLVFGNIGRYNDLQTDLTPSLNAETATLSGEGLDVTGVGTLPAWYTLGGLRAEIPASRHALPYVLGGLGTARLKPDVQFMFANGALPDGTVPAVGTDVTSTLEMSGVLLTPSRSNAFMYTLGGGVQVPVAQHWAADLGYRYSRIAADTALNSGALRTNAMTFGFGYRF
jgi:opacity protein-like surface antigen